MAAALLRAAFNEEFSGLSGEYSSFTLHAFRPVPVSGLKISFKRQRQNIMQALEKLGIRLTEDIPVQTLLSEHFNPGLYGITGEQAERVSALRDIVAIYNSTSAKLPASVRDSRSAASLLYTTLQALGHEEVWVAFMNRNCEVTHLEMIFKGTLDETTMSCRDIVAKALSEGASAVILYHNHPSGNPSPSAADVKQTEKLRDALKVFEIGLVDHVIISRGKYYSFSDESVSSMITRTTKTRK